MFRGEQQISDIYIKVYFSKFVKHDKDCLSSWIVFLAIKVATFCIRTIIVVNKVLLIYFMLNSNSLFNKHYLSKEVIQKICINNMTQSQIKFILLCAGFLYCVLVNDRNLNFADTKIYRHFGSLKLLPIPKPKCTPYGYRNRYRYRNRKIKILNII
jgi:hypothetical protein